MVVNTSFPSISGNVGGLTPVGKAADSGAKGFSDLLRDAVGNADGLQANADAQISNLLQGAPGADVGNVMASVEKAGIAFQLMLQVRNKVVSAYQDIEKMQF